MRRAQVLLLSAALVTALPASSSVAQQGTAGLPLVPLGYCRLTTTLASAGGLSSCSGTYGTGIPSRANVVVLRAEAQTVRYTDDGVTAPTSTVGMPLLVADPPLTYQGPLTNLQFIQAASSASLDVSFYHSP